MNHGALVHGGCWETFFFFFFLLWFSGSNPTTEKLK